MAPGAAGRRAEGAARPPATPLDPLVLEFLDHVRYERGLSLNTVEAYGRDLRRYAEFLVPRRVLPSEAGADDLRAYFEGRGETARPAPWRAAPRPCAPSMRSSPGRA